MRILPNGFFLSHWVPYSMHITLLRGIGIQLDYPLNCKSVSFPEFTMGSSTVTFLNYSFDISNRSNTTRKDLQITFLISENWLQYLMLLKWFELEDFTRYDMNRSDTVLIDIGDVQQTVTNSEYQRYMTESRIESLLFNARTNSQYNSLFNGQFHEEASDF